MFHGTSKLNIMRCMDDTGAEQLLVVSSKKLNFHEPAGYVSRLRIIVRDDRSYKLQGKDRINM